MSLKIIGAGFGRTGTLSLKTALEALGYAPCHHMETVIGDAAQAHSWIAAATAPDFDWERLLAGYGAAVDWPTCYFWRELMGFYPQAKLILTVRDAADWYASMQSTIAKVLHPPEGVAVPLPPAMIAMATLLVRDGTFAGRLDDRAYAIEVFERHNRTVIAAVPAERLLVYRLEDGWEPLCRFLHQPVPALPFPHSNSTAEWRQRVRV